MVISTTPKRKDDTSHTPEPQAEEDHDTEITVIVTPPTTSLKSILKHKNPSPPVDYESPKKLPAPSNEIRAAMTSSPSSPESPEHRYSTPEAPGNNKKAGDLTQANEPVTNPRTRSVKRKLTSEFNPTKKDNPKTQTHQAKSKPPTTSHTNQNKMRIGYATSNN